MKIALTLPPQQNERFDTVPSHSGPIRKASVRYSRWQFSTRLELTDKGSVTPPFDLTISLPDGCDVRDVETPISDMLARCSVTSGPPAIVTVDRRADVPPGMCLVELSEVA